MTGCRAPLSLALFFFGSVVLCAQKGSLINKAGTNLGTRASFLKDCKQQWTKARELRMFDRERFCTCMEPIVLASPAVAQSKNPYVLNAVDLRAFLNNSPTAYDEIAKCTGLDMTTMRLSAMGPEGIRTFRSGCTEQLAKDPNITANGANADKLCDCLVDAIMQRDLTIGDLQAAMNPNSPLFNEVFVPCVTDAIPTSSAYHSSPDDISGPQGAATVPVISLGKVHKVKVRVGGTEQYFIVDSGAEDCIISSTFAQELVKAGAIDTTERIPPRDYMMADGSKVTYQRHVISGLEIGPFKVSRVMAASVDQNIHYLLGKSFLNKFSEWRIDEVGKTFTLQR